MKAKAFALIILAVCLWHTASSFTPSDSVRRQYIEDYPDRFYLKPIYTIRNLDMTIRSRSSGLKVNYNPNGNTYLGLGFYVFSIGIETSFKLPENSNKINVYGKTDAFDFQSNLYAKKWGADIAIQRYDGFYIENPKEHFTNWNNSDPFPQRPDVTINQILVNGFYLINHRKFSYRSAYNQSDRQRKSGGSFLVGLNFLNQQISADTSLIPGQSQPTFNVKDFHYSKVNSFGILGGYTHTFIKNYFYMNISFSGGPAHVWTEYEEDNLNKDKTQYSLLLNFRAALGYNNPRWFAGVTYVNQQSNQQTSHLDIRVESGNIKLFVGYRFKEVGFLKKNLF